MAITPVTFGLFVDRLVEHGCTYVNARTCRRLVRFRDKVSYWFGATEPFLWEDYNEYGSTSPRDQEIVYTEKFGVRRYSVRAGVDEGLRNDLNIRCLITAWDRLYRIQLRTSGIQYNVITTVDAGGPIGRYVPINLAMSAEVRDRLFSEADEQGIEPFPLGDFA